MDVSRGVQVDWQLRGVPDRPLALGRRGKLGSTRSAPLVLGFGFSSVFLVAWLAVTLDARYWRTRIMAPVKVSTDRSIAPCASDCAVLRPRLTHARHPRRCPLSRHA
jgi:hypothetical protein